MLTLILFTTNFIIGFIVGKNSKSVSDSDIRNAIEIAYKEGYKQGTMDTFNSIKTKEHNFGDAPIIMN